MLMRAVIAGLTISIATTGSRADLNHYLCIVDQSVGLHFDEQTQQWVPKDFAPGRKYIFRQLNDNDLKEKWAALLPHSSLPKQTWALFDFGDDEPLVSCQEASDPDDAFYCREIIKSFRFDKESLRFEIADIGGYTFDALSARMRERLHLPKLRGGPSDLMIEIGTCSPL